VIELNDAFLALQTRSEISEMLNVIFTPKELKEIGNRWQACQMMLQGDTQRAIIAALHVGSTTAARCAKAVREAHSDFDQVIKRLGLPPRKLTSST
jgi:uncharacterized protein YerC